MQFPDSDSSGNDYQDIDVGKDDNFAMACVNFAKRCCGKCDSKLVESQIGVALRCPIGFKCQPPDHNVELIVVYISNLIGKHVYIVLISPQMPIQTSELHIYVEGIRSQDELGDANGAFCFIGAANRIVSANDGQRELTTFLKRPKPDEYFIRFTQCAMEIHNNVM